MIHPNRNLKFKANRRLPFGKRGIVFREKGVEYRKQGVTFSDDGVSNIDIRKAEDPIMLNNKGVEFYNQGKYKLALEYFNRALAVSPQFEMARRNRLYCTKMIRQRRTTVLEQREKEFQRSRSAESKGKATTVYAYKTPVSSQKMDYSRSKYSDLDQYGRIPKKKKSKDDVGDYMDQLGWDTYRGKW